MSSTTDWSLVGGDPAPGWPVTIKAQAGSLDKIGRFVDDSEREVRLIVRSADTAGLRGHAADALGEFLDDLQADLRPIANSFKTLSRVMTRYADELENIQVLANRALKQAKLHKQSEDQNQQQLDSVRQKLRNQRSQLRTAQWNATQHRIQAGASNVVDPGGAIQRAHDQQNLDRETNRLDAAVSQSVAAESTYKTNRDNARADFAAEQARINRYHDDFNRISNDAASRVDAALASQLKNRSNFQKFVDRVSAEISAIQEFMDKGDYLGALRQLVSSLQTVIGVLLLVGLIAVAVVGTGGLLATVVGALFFAAKVLTVAKLVLTAAVLVQAQLGGHSTDATVGDLAVDALSVALMFAASSGAAGAAKGAKLSNKELLAKVITGDKGGAVGGREVAKYLGKEVIEDNVKGVFNESLKTTVNFAYTAAHRDSNGNYDTILNKELKYEFKPKLGAVGDILKYGWGFDPKYTVDRYGNTYSSEYESPKRPGHSENSWGSVNPVGAGSHFSGGGGGGGGNGGW